MSRPRDPLVVEVETLKKENPGEYANLSPAIDFILYNMTPAKYVQFSDKFKTLDNKENKTSIFEYPHTPSSWALPNAARRLARTIPSEEEMKHLRLAEGVLVKNPGTDDEKNNFKLNLIYLLWNYYYNKKYRRLAIIIQQQFPDLQLPPFLGGGYRRRKSRRGRKSRKARKSRRS